MANDHERFFAKVRKSSGCWLWTGAVYAESKFGAFRCPDGKTRSAHHFSWSLAGYDLPAGVRLMHTCGDRLCVNPAHLYPATAENILTRNMRKHGSGCWEWTGRRTEKMGYGIVGHGAREIMAHRLAYETWRGPVPVGKFILHSCDNPWCIKPDHLFIGTKGENNADRHEKGRTARGEKIARHSRGSLNVRAKLTEQDVVTIRAAAASSVRNSHLAQRFGIDPSQVSHIVARRCWKHI